MGWILGGIRLFLSLCLLGFCAFTLLSVWAAEEWKRARRPINLKWTPGVTILKPVRGVDAEAWENFSSFCKLDYPADKVQILFGALDADDPALELARRLQKEYPSCDISVHVAPPDALTGNNRKVCNLEALLPHAKHPYLVLCDSDMRVSSDYLRRILAPFENPDEVAEKPVLQHLSRKKPLQTALPARPVGLVTCPYRGGRVLSFAAVVEALGIGAEFIPSVLFSRATEGVSFALGSTIALPKTVLDKMGGFAPLKDELADDYRIGNGVYKAGYSIVLSDYVIEDVLGREKFAVMWARRLRWARTLRSCRPGGYAGAFVTHGTPLALLFLASMRGGLMGWEVYAAILAIRWIAVLTISRRCTQDPNLVRFLPLLPLSDLIGFVLYLLSFFGDEIVWRGERFRLLPGGRLEKSTRY